MIMHRALSVTAVHGYNGIKRDTQTEKKERNHRREAMGTMRVCVSMI